MAGTRTLLMAPAQRVSHAAEFPLSDSDLSDSAPLLITKIQSEVSQMDGAHVYTCRTRSRSTHKLFRTAFSSQGLAYYKLKMYVKLVMGGAAMHQLYYHAQYTCNCHSRSKTLRACQSLKVVPLPLAQVHHVSGLLWAEVLFAGGRCPHLSEQW